MIRPTRVETRPGHRIWLEYSDGVAGEVDLSYLVGRGIFKAWDEPGYFERAHITSHRSIAWNEEIELCPDAMYMRITGKTFEEMYADTQPAYSNA